MARVNRTALRTLGVLVALAAAGGQAAAQTPAPPVDRVMVTALVSERDTVLLQAGDEFSVVVRMDLTHAGGRGDLGAVQLELLYDPALLEYRSAQPDVKGLGMANLRAPGRAVFAFASTEPQASASFALVTFHFRVAPAARAATTRLGVNFPEPLMSTTLRAYAEPSVRASVIRIAQRG